MVIITACSSSAHRFSTCFRTGVPSSVKACNPAELFRLGQCYSGSGTPRRYSASGSRLSGPVVRKARGNARRRRARSRHARLGCRYAPRPGSRAGGSGWMASPAATRRSRLDLAARSLQPTQVRITGVSGACCSARVAITSSSLPPSQACSTDRELRWAGGAGAGGSGMAEGACGACLARGASCLRCRLPAGARGLASAWLCGCVALRGRVPPRGALLGGLRQGAGGRRDGGTACLRPTAGGGGRLRAG